MKKAFITLCAVFLAIGIVSTAKAEVIEKWYDPSDIFLKAYGSPSSVDWWMYITPEYNPSTMYVSDAWIKLYLRGDSDSASEEAEFQVSTSALQTWSLSNPNEDISLQITAALPSLQDGNGYFLLTATLGDFYFEKARLRATVNAVPEPMSLLLLGLGLLGIGVARRKK